MVVKKMNKPPPSEDEMDAMFGYPKHQPTLADLEEKINVLTFKIDRIRNEITSFGIGVIVVMALIYYNK